VVTPDEETKQRNRDAGESNERVTENSLLAVNRNQLTDHAHRRQNHDVNRRVRVEPEEVLKQNRVSAVLGIKDTNVHRLFGDQHQQCDTQNRCGQNLNDRRGVK